MGDKRITKLQIRFFKRIPFRLKLVAVEALFLLAIARFAILFIPFRRIASIMGKPMRETPEEINPVQLTVARQIAWFINKISRYTPWESKCLVKALTGQIMLKKRKIPCTLYLGMAKDKTNKLSAHAWLRCGDSILLGDNERAAFVTVAYFSVF